MYIGPWQEYKLSKQSKQPSVSDSVRNDIENAILASLDPESAQKAIDALNPLLNKNAQQITNGRPPANRRNNRNRNSNVGYLPPIQALLTDNNTRSARDYGRAVSPLSVRSSKSEPIRSTKLPQLDTSNLSPAVHLQTNGSYVQQPSSVLSSGQYKLQGSGVQNNPMYSQNGIQYSYSNDSQQLQSKQHIDVKLPNINTSQQSNTASQQKHMNLLSPNTQQAHFPTIQQAQVIAQQNRANDKLIKQQQLRQFQLQQQADFSSQQEYKQVQNSGQQTFVTSTATTATPSSDQPPYNAPAVLNLLRLERNKQARHKIKNLTGWNGAATTLTENTELSQHNDTVAQKLQHVNTMKSVYLNKNTTSVAVSDVAVSDSGVSDTYKPITPLYDIYATTNNSLIPPAPQIQDLQLTESEFQQISKYFTTSSSNLQPSVAVASAATSATNSLYTTTPSKQHRSYAAAVTSSTPQHSTLSDSRTQSPRYTPYKSPNKPQDHSDNNSYINRSTVKTTSRGMYDTTPRSIHTPDQDISSLDDLYGGVDGLLKWSSALDIDSI